MRLTLWPLVSRARSVTRRDQTPWPAWLAVAARLGVAPKDFWMLSLKEWLALTAPPAAVTLPRAAFDALVARFPDAPHE